MRIKLISLLAIATLSVPICVHAQYSLVVEKGMSETTENLNVFKLYVQLEDKTDRVSAIFGTEKHPLVIIASSGIYNSLYNASWSASGINSKFIELAPDLADDSYATIGLVGPAGESVKGAQDPVMVEDASQPWSMFFTNNGSIKLEMNTRTGGSWFVLKTATNGEAGKDKKVLFASLSTLGTISGVINAQIFPKGEGSESIKVTFSFEGEGTFQGVSFSK